MRRLALLGGAAAFPDGLPFARPARPPLEEVVARLEPGYTSGALTTGPLVRELEEAVAARLGVAHAVAVSSCTSGLMLVLQALVPPGRHVLMPGFTFSASAHAARWAGVVPAFAECGAADLQLDVADARTRLERLDGRAGAVMGVHMGGAPCHPDELAALAATYGIPLVFDAAHGFGATHGERAVGSLGRAEVFSLSPTKPLVAGEGGLVTTDDPDLALRIRQGRDYGNPGDYDPRFAGLNARMSELHAAVALASLARLDDHLARRRALAARYTELLADVPGVRPQVVEPTDRSTHKLFTVVVDEREAGVTRDDVVAALRAEGVDTRRYFDPPVHRQAVYREDAEALPTTEWVSDRVVSLPLWRDVPDGAVDTVATVVAEIVASAAEVRAARESSEEDAWTWSSPAVPVS